MTKNKKWKRREVSFSLSLILIWVWYFQPTFREHSDNWITTWRNIYRFWTFRGEELVYGISIIITNQLVPIFKKAIKITCFITIKPVVKLILLCF